MTEIKRKADEKAAGIFAYVYTSDNEHFNIQREAHKLFDGINTAFKIARLYMCMYVHECVCICVCARACARACV